MHSKTIRKWTAFIYLIVPKSANISPTNLSKIVCIHSRQTICWPTYFRKQHCSNIVAFMIKHKHPNPKLQTERKFRNLIHDERRFLAGGDNIIGISMRLYLSSHAISFASYAYRFFVSTFWLSRMSWNTNNFIDKLNVLCIVVASWFI